MKITANKRQREAKGFGADMSNCLGADYGGAFDIEPDMFFTREEIDEFADEVATELDSELPGVNVFVHDVYMTDSSHIHMEFSIEDEDGPVTAVSEIRVDFRRIQKPSDLMKYKESAKQPVRNVYNEYFGPFDTEEAQDSITSAYDPTFDDSRLEPPEYDDPKVTEGEEEISITFSGQIRVMNDGSWDWVDTSYPWSKNKGSNLWEGEFYPVTLCDSGDVEEYVRDGIADYIPSSTPGYYLVSGDAEIIFDVKAAEDFSGDYYREGSEAEFSDIYISNFKCIPVRG